MYNNDHKKDLVSAAKYLLKHYDIMVETEPNVAAENLAHAVGLLVIAQNVWNSSWLPVPLMI